MKKVCHNCLYRQGRCHLQEIVEDSCPAFRVGKCFSCKYAFIVNNCTSNSSTDAWFRRGCESHYPSGCFKRKRLSWKKKKKLKKKGNVICSM